MRRELTNWLHYRLEGYYPPDFASLGDSFVMRTLEYKIKVESIMRKLERPLDLQTKTVYYILLAQLEKADGASNTSALSAYRWAGYKMGRISSRRCARRVEYGVTKRPQGHHVHVTAMFVPDTPSLL